MTDILLQVGVKILLKNSDGKFLLLRRSLEKYPEIKGRWDIVGGRIDPGIALKENLIREMDGRLAAMLGPHRIGDPWPEVGVRDWALLAGVVLRIFETMRQSEER